MKRFSAFFSLLFFSFSLLSQPSPSNISVLKIEDIMQGEQFVGFLPQSISWSEDSRKVYFSWNPDADTLRNIYQLNIGDDGAIGEPQKLTNDQRRNRSGNGEYNKARTKKVYSKNGDLFLMDLTANVTVQITNTLASEIRPLFSGDEKQLLFLQKNNLFAWEMENGTFSQLSDFKGGTKKGEEHKDKQDEWLERDQLEMFKILSQRKSEREARKRQDEAMKPKRPKTYYYGKKSLSNIRVSPDLRFITFRLTKRGEGERTKVPNYVTETGRIDNLGSRPKVGSPVHATELGIYDRQLDSIYLVDPSQIEGIYDKPDFLRDYWPDTLPFEEKYKMPRAVVFHGPVFSEEGEALVSAKSQDNKDRWIFLLDLPTSELKLLDRQHDDAWVGGPGISNYNMVSGNMGWMPDKRCVWFQSEETGYSHLYSLDLKSGKKKALTKGSFEILQVQLSNDKQHFYLSSNKESPFEHHFYKMPVGGGKMEKITTKPGNHQVQLSPDEKWLAIRYSFSNQPWELYLMPNEAGAEMKQVTHSTTDDFKKYDWREPDLVRFTASDGVAVPARLYRPKEGNGNGAAVIFVHGAGYLQNVHRWWSSYYREYMFHHILSDNGFTVLDIDYRGSNGYGRDWRTAIYRFMGGKDLSDQVDGARYLAEELGIDAGRIGIYGGSYGGFITLMGLFTSPGHFKSGAALRSVTDWAHYNHAYTSNILNTPVEDSIAFRKSSPIYHAEGLQDNLLILHGVIDINVQFQDVVRLAQRLVELGKDNWEFAVFPLEGHGFVEPSSWADEYKRIYKLFSETLRD